MRVDSAEWHLQDAGSWQRAATHIALIWAYLVEDGRLAPGVAEDVGIPLPLDRARTPSELFGELSDFALVADDFDEPGRRLLARYPGYLTDLGWNLVDGLERDPELAAPYDVADTWQNVAIAGEHLETFEWVKRLRRRVAGWSERADSWAARVEARRRPKDDGGAAPTS